MGDAAAAPEEHFHKGIALSVWQNSSDQSSQWTQFVKDRNFFGQARFQAAWEHSNDFWNRWAASACVMLQAAIALCTSLHLHCISQRARAASGPPTTHTTSPQLPQQLLRPTCMHRMASDALTPCT